MLGRVFFEGSEACENSGIARWISQSVWQGVGVSVIEKLMKCNCWGSNTTF